MKKVLVLVEGQTEETFVKRLLSPHLELAGVSAVPTILVTKKVKSGPHFKGGVPSYTKVKKEIQRLLGDSSAALVTMMLDYYGLPTDFPGRGESHGSKPIERVQHVEGAITADIGDPRFRAYLSLHEFEALLFSSPDEIAHAFTSPECQPALSAIRAKFQTPEDIDDHPDTCSSARLRGLFPGYSKPLHGALISARIGLELMRQQCPHFDAWMRGLGGVGSSSPAA